MADPGASMARAPLHPALLPEAREDLAGARRVAAGCTACDLWTRATQTVFGEGPARAGIMLLGEQPGDTEDLAGHPFVGPAGEMLARAMGEAGIRREDVFVTNVVKHFKWRPSGKRRLHERPNAAEIRACRPWFELELELVRPAVLVLLGATAATAVLGRGFRLTDERGRLIPPDAGATDGGPAGPARIATFHPSAILRAPDREARATMFASLVADLETAAGALAPGPGATGPARRSGSARRGARAGRS